ncbi:pyridoxal-phosphate dependent enzyme [Nocardia sp. XZ_19_369]|uniref:pyridoxal-phosphate dependent enzyme n=1 Tax=Nocardia sp. XZ_19_369 TaxID=2769487 RepID=UPI00188F70C3|nr:pyridoxal-phosphate dependent enzyme [Nocardia sp. XZ_19_369]
MSDIESDNIDVPAAEQRLTGQVMRTPIRRLPWLERLVGVPVYAKLEVQQHTGSFKFRGALNAALAGPQRPIIAASAGNHGLAVADVARRLRRPANICIPVMASRLKRERILATGVGLLEHGNSLEQATTYAREIAERQGLYYISPYNNPHVIAGAATVALEVLDEIDDVAAMIAPIGGGGLISGLALGAATRDTSVRIFGCEPERYRSMSASLDAQGVARVVHQPTLADGLAVNLDPDSITYPLVRDRVESIITLSEEDLAAATLALLVHESLLVEPAGAAAIVACLRLADAGALTGPVVLPLCGGNLHHTTLTRIQRYPYADKELVRLLDLRGRTIDELPISRALRIEPDVGERAAADDGATAETDARSSQDEQVRSWLHRLSDVLAELEEYVNYCAEADVLVDSGLVGQVRADCERAGQRLVEVLGIRGDGDRPEDAARVEMVVRHAANTVASAQAAFDWCAPSHAQAKANQFFDVGAQDSPTANYERYDSVATARVEAQLAEVFGLDPETQVATATSSGMAAYALIEAFLLRYRLRAGDTVLLAPYVYFETVEQICSLPSVRTVTALSYSVEGLVDTVLRERPRCVFVDPIANTAEQRMVDLPSLVRTLEAVVTDPITLVVDGTMAPAALSCTLLDAQEPVEVLYYESCSKYLQLGMDMGMAGVVASKANLRPALDRLRRNTGSILYRHNAQLFPRYDRVFFQRRMHRICGNAATVARSLRTRAEVCAVADVVHPSSGAHPDDAIARSLPYAGGCVTFTLHEAGANHRDQLEALIEHILERARRTGLHLTKGVSFGYNTPRVSAAASMAEGGPPFLRLYIGDRSPEQVALLAQVTGDAIAAIG